jgi:hypothetical protein
MSKTHRRIILVQGTKCTAGSHELARSAWLHEIVILQDDGTETPGDGKVYCPAHLSNLLAEDHDLMADGIVQLFRERKPGIRDGQAFP